MKNIFLNFKVNFLTYFFIILLFFTGLFKECLIMGILIVVHEMGHVLMAKHFNWKVEKIDLYPYGGCVKFDAPVNSSLKEELLIMLNGPFFQILLFLIIAILYNNNFISDRNFILFKEYNSSLLFFNLLPIYPLDGGKLLNIIFNILLPYKKGNILTIFVSFLFIIMLCILMHNLNSYLMICLLLVEIILYFKRQDFLYNRMLLERYLDVYNFKRIKVIYDKNNLYKERKHVIKWSNTFITEKEYLNKRYGRK